MEKPKIDSKTESQFSSSMPYLEDSTPLIDDNSIPSVINTSDSHDSVFVSDSSQVALCQTLVMMYQVLYPLLSPTFQEEVPGVPEGKPLKGMERFIPLIP